MTKMLRFLVLVFVGVATPAMGQVSYVTMTGTNASYANGTMTANFLAPQGSSQFDYINERFPFYQQVTLNGSGAWTMPLADTSTLNPAGSQWRLQLCSQSIAGSTPTCYTVITPITCVNNGSCSGTTLDLTSTFAAAPTPPGGGGTLPSGSKGQILSNSDGSHAYAAQGQVYYNQAGDTISSIEAACTSLCTYIVTVPQTITLAASHTLSGNVQLEFNAGGKWTVNGAFTLTIPGNVTGTLNQHFAGSSTIAFGLLQQYANVEWFGAAGDGTTDDTTPIQNTFNALVAGQAVLQATTYKTTAALTIAKSSVGVHGQGIIVQNTGSYPNPSASVIKITSASADVIDVTGTTPSNYTAFNRFDNLTLERSVVPSGTAAGLSVSNTYGVSIDRVFVQDAIRGFYIHGTGSQGVGYIENSGVQWGYNGVSETTGSLYGFYVDSSDGLQSPSLRVRHSFAASSASGPTTYGWYDTGSAINDRMVYGFETASLSYGEYLNATGTPSTFGFSDIHFKGTINDSPLISGIFVTGITNAGAGSVVFEDGESTSLTNTGTAVDIESSTGVAIVNHQVWGTWTKGFYVNGGSGNIVSSNNLPRIAGSAIVLNATASNTVSGNVARGNAATNCVLMTTATLNSVTGNTCLGAFTNGINADSASNNNTGFETDVFGASVTNPVVNAGSNPVVISDAGGDNGAVGLLWLKESSSLGQNMILMQATNSGGAAALTMKNDTNTLGGLYAGGTANAVTDYRNNIYLYNSFGDVRLRANNDVNFYAGTTGTPATPDIGISHTNHVTSLVAMKSTVYTVATLPAASSLPAGTQVEVSDGAGTPPTCTGSGTNYQIAITNGSAWSCH